MDQSSFDTHQPEESLTLIHIINVAHAPCMSHNQVYTGSIKPSTRWEQYPITSVRAAPRRPPHLKIRRVLSKNMWNWITIVRYLAHTSGGST